MAMLGEDAITVVITASKEVETSPTDATKKEKFTMYTVIVRNQVTNAKCIVKRRYSDFYKLRKELIEFVSWGHCQYCDHYAQHIAEYHFPRRRLLRSSQSSVVKERMDSLQLFLRHMLLCIMHKKFDDCEQARANIEQCLLRSFLEIDHDDLVLSKSNTKAHILQAMEEKRHQQQVKVAGLRAKNVGYAMERPEKQSKHPRPQVVDADTCHKCRQKWTHCYCNDEDDGVFPQHVRHASNASDTSVCSRCDQDWDHCYCCQQVSPTVSSACTEY